MTEASADIAIFLTALSAIEDAWALLDVPAPSAAEIEEAVRLGGGSAHVLLRAAGLIAPFDPERAHGLLEQAVALDAPPAPAQLALARSFRARGDEAQASLWLRGAMLRARPDGALLLELAAIERDHARALVDAAQAFPCRDITTAEEAVSALLGYGKREEARIAGTIAFEAGARGGDFLILYSDLLGNSPHDEEPSLPPGPLGVPHGWHVASRAGQVRLGRFYPAAPLIAQARAREASDRWIGGNRLSDYLKDRIDAAAPFSWIRLGDGEARFLLHLHPELRAVLPDREARAMAAQIWYAWFGQDIGEIPPERMSALGARLEQAIGNADLLGVSSAERLAGDVAHYGFCAGLEAFLAALPGDRSNGMLTDSLATLALNEQDPFLGSLLRGIDFLGVISPHPDLADRLQRHLNIGAVASYDLPGESRLARANEALNRGTHFPAVYDRLLATLTIPRPGAVFLVAGGLLGKIYCDQIRALGGIALDIGSLADAWTGHNTRGPSLDMAVRQQLPA